MAPTRASAHDLLAPSHAKQSHSIPAIPIPDLPPGLGTPSRHRQFQSQLPVARHLAQHRGPSQHCVALGEQLRCASLLASWARPEEQHWCTAWNQALKGEVHLQRPGPGLENSLGYSPSVSCVLVSHGSTLRPAP